MTTKKIKLDEATKKAMLLCQPMHRDGGIKYTPLAYLVAKIPVANQPWFDLRQLTKGEIDQVEIIKNQTALDIANLKDPSGEDLHALNERKRDDLTKAIGKAITGWGNYIDPEALVYVEYDLEQLPNMREDILFDILGEACAITGIRIQ